MRALSVRNLSNVYPACSFFTISDLFCIDNACAIGRKIRYYTGCPYDILFMLHSHELSISCCVMYKSIRRVAQHLLLFDTQTLYHIFHAVLCTKSLYHERSNLCCIWNTITLSGCKHLTLYLIQRSLVPRAVLCTATISEGSF
jgi:hypothetical protein